MEDIVVGVDRSDSARRAALAAADLASAYGTNLHVVMCVERRSPLEVAVGAERFRTDWLSEAEQYLADLVRSLPHRRATYTVGVGDPATTLCEEAQRLSARAIVVGNRRVQGTARVLGSVAGDVTRRAPCHVLVASTVAHG